MKCSNCKKEIPDSAKVCGYCGTKQAQSAPPKKTAPTAPKPKKTTTPAAPPAERGTLKWLLPAVFAVLVIIAAILVWVFVLSPSPAAEAPAPEAPSGESASKPSQPDSGGEKSITPAVLAGTWIGEDIIFIFDNSCAVNVTCGYFEFPGGEVSGPIKITYQNGNEFGFVNPEGDAEVYEEWLRYIGPGSVEFYSSSEFGDSHEFLIKQ